MKSFSASLLAALAGLVLLAATAQADTTYTLNKSFPATLTAVSAGSYQCSVLRRVLEDMQAKTPATLGRTWIRFSDTGSSEAVYTLDLNTHGASNPAYYILEGQTVSGWSITWERTGTAPVAIERDALQLMVLGHGGMVTTIKGLKFRSSAAMGGGDLFWAYPQTTIEDCEFDQLTGVNPVTSVGGNGVVVYGGQNDAEAAVFKNCKFYNGVVPNSAGMNLLVGSVVFNGCEWYNNIMVMNVGSGAWGDATNPVRATLNNCAMRDATQSWGGLRYFGGYVTCNDCTFNNVQRVLEYDYANTSGYRSGNVEFNRCTMVGSSTTPNYVLFLRGQANNNSASTFTLNNCTILQPAAFDAVRLNCQTADLAPGAVHINNCLIRHTDPANVTGTNGVRWHRGGHMTLTNTVVKGFQTNIYLAQPTFPITATIQHCVLDGATNRAVDSFLDSSGVNLTIKNSIIGSANANGIYLASGGALTVKDISHNLLLANGNVTGSNSFTGLNPAFVNAAGDDYHLTPASQCTRLAPILPSALTDVDGQTRPLPTLMGGLCDLGIDEITENSLSAVKLWDIY